ncbi:MAG: hypothetical protein LIO94_11575 [Clostridiales bacterium]|nr:hypothetical protein [Clostridiales bacterium]
MKNNRPKWEYHSLDEIAEAFESPAVKAISFDLFDTLIVRPLARPDDLYELMDEKFARLSGAQISFRRLRVEAEAFLRRRIGNAPSSGFGTADFVTAGLATTEQAIINIATVKAGIADSGKEEFRKEEFRKEEFRKEEFKREEFKKEEPEKKELGKKEFKKENLRKEGIRKEDFGLDEIYQVMIDEFHLAADVANAMKQLEFELELELCVQRKSGKLLFDRAIATGKPVILISDMYLSREQIALLAQKNGYGAVSRIFVSSEYALRKITGHLYDAVSEAMDLAPCDIFHIGDNLEADCRIADSRGFQCAWLPKALDAYETHGCAHQVEKICADLTDWEAAQNSVGIGCMRAMAAEKYFDDPFRPFNRESDYNTDPYFVGYGALGMEVLALVRWLAENLRRDQAQKMVFMARDGYLPMKAYEICRAYYPELPPSGYLHASRLSLLPAMLTAPEDLFGLPVDISYQTPRKILRLLAFCTKDEALDFLENSISGEEASAAHTAFPPDEAFTRETWHEFIADFIRTKYDARKHRRAVGRISEYLLHNEEAPLSEQSAVFDMGYSGRSAAAIYNAANIAPFMYYFHTDAREHYRCEYRTGKKIRAFFDFNPYMESSLREYSYLEPAASCVGYTEDLKPVYDSGPAPGYREIVLAMQKGALDFVSDYMNYFSKYESGTGFRAHDAAMPFEAFLRYCSTEDRKMYGQVWIDDELWGGRRDINLRELMEIRLRKIPDYAK